MLKSFTTLKHDLGSNCLIRPMCLKLCEYDTIADCCFLLARCPEFGKYIKTHTENSTLVSLSLVMRVNGKCNNPSTSSSGSLVPNT